jgi:hypothetical protein
MVEGWNNDQGCFLNSFPNIPVLQHSNGLVSGNSVRETVPFIDLAGQIRCTFLDGRTEEKKFYSGERLPALYWIRNVPEITQPGGCGYHDERGMQWESR